MKVFKSLFFFLFSFLSFSQTDGSLDTNFNTDGYVSIPYPNVSGVYPTFVEELNDGSYIVGVNTNQQNKAKQAFLTKFNPDGSLDVSFGDNGRLIFSTINEEDGSYSINTLYSIHRLNSQELIIAGIIEDKQTFIKIDNDGNFISNYGGLGFKTISEGKLGTHQALLSDGKIIAATTFKIDSLNVFRNNFSKYTVNGHLDSGFGTNGSLVLDITEQNIDMFSKVVDYSPNSFIAVGNSMPYISYDTGFIAKFNYDGSYDSNFGQYGVITMDYPFLGQYTTLNDMVIQHDKKILVCGISLFNGGTGGGNYFASVPLIARFNADGSLDSTFGNNGFFMNSSALFGANERYQKITLLPDNKILVLGTSSLPFPFMKTAVIVRRFNADGSPDLSFGNNSYFHYLNDNNANFTEANSGLSIQVLENNKIIVLARHRRHEVPWEGRMFRLHVNFLSQNNFSDSSITYYPNPVKDVLNITSANNIERVYVYSTNGRLVKIEENFDSSTLDLSDLISGSYLLILYDNNSNKKVIKVIKD